MTNVRLRLFLLIYRMEKDTELRKCLLDKLLVEKMPVTYKWLSYQCSVDFNESKAFLERFVKTLDSSKQIGIILYCLIGVPQTNLIKTKKSLHS